MLKCRVHETKVNFDDENIKGTLYNYKDFTHLVDKDSTKNNVKSR